MSNSLAVAATTATLRNLLHQRIPDLDGSLSDIEVTTQPLDLARKHVTKSQLNIFLYQTVINAGWRNLNMPGQVRPGESGAPPLALNLHYLITAYGRGDDHDGVNHQVLGAAMSVLHDTPVLNRADIAAALASNDLGEQFESLRITPLPSTVDEFSKLWMIFQTQYRISAAYEVTVVLIDSLTPRVAPLPVLQRGEKDRGVTSFAGALPQPQSIDLPQQQSAARLGDDIVLKGKHLDAQGAVVRFKHQRLAKAVELAPLPSTGADGLGVHIPSKADTIDVLKTWAPGQYTVQMIVRPPGVPDLASEPVYLALAPQIVLSTNAATKGTVNLSVDCEPRIAAGQNVYLLFGNLPQVAPANVKNPPDKSKPTTLDFKVPHVTPGTYTVRLRVDGADSIPATYGGTPPVWSFDGAQQVVVI